MLYIFFFSNIR